jgi:hypothetical protein
LEFNAYLLACKNFLAAEKRFGTTVAGNQIIRGRLIESEGARPGDLSSPMFGAERPGEQDNAPSP